MSMAHMELDAATELLDMPDEAAAPLPASQSTPGFRRHLVLLTTLGFLAALALIGLSVTQASPSAHRAPLLEESDATIVEASIVEEAMGRPLTEKESNALAQQLPQHLRLRLLKESAATPRKMWGKSLSQECQTAFGSHLKKTVRKIGTAAFTTALACVGGQESQPCKEAQGKMTSLEDDLKDDCVKEPSTDLCSQSGDDMDTIQTCVPKSCQNSDDLDALAKKDSTISCGGGAGIFQPILNVLHLPSLR
jgi:hypothetical protein